MKNIQFAAPLALGLLVGGACSGEGTTKKGLAEGCVRNSECAGSLVCTLGRCHEECRETQDCPEGSRCIKASDELHVCQLEEEGACSNADDCPQPLVCASDSVCRNECRSAHDCVQSQVCAAEGVCADQQEVDAQGHLVGTWDPGAGGATGGATGGVAGDTSSGSAAGTGAPGGGGVVGDVPGGARGEAIGGTVGAGGQRHSGAAGRENVGGERASGGSNGGRKGGGAGSSHFGGLGGAHRAGGGGGGLRAAAGQSARGGSGGEAGNVAQGGKAGELPTWGEPTLIATPSYEQRSPVVFNGFGEPVAFVSHSGGYGLYRYDGSSAEWLATLEGSPVNTDRAVGLDSHGHGHLVFAYQQGVTLYQIVSSARGPESGRRSFVYVQSLAADAPGSGVSFSTTSAGDGVAAWSQNVQGTTKVYAAEYRSNGDLWGSAFEMALGAGIEEQPLAAAGEQGRAAVVWQIPCPGDSDQIFVRTGWLPGPVWSEPFSVAGVACPATAPVLDVGVDEQDRVHVVWVRDGVLSARQSVAEGSWDPVRVLATDAEAFTLAIPHTGRPWVVWSDAQGRIRGNRYNVGGSTWGDAITLHDAAAAVSDMDTSTTSSGDMLLVYREGVGGRARLGTIDYQAALNTWLEPQYVPTQGTPTTPQIALSETGAAVVVWTDVFAGGRWSNFRQ